jgi:hypothetical protein
VEEKIPKTIAEGVNEIANFSGDSIACVFSQTDLRLFLPSETPVELVFPFKEDLLSVGFFESDLKPVLRAVFEGEKRVLVYNVKDIKHKLFAKDIGVFAPIEDVSLMKYIQEGVGGGESLAYALETRGFSPNQGAYGVYKLYRLFSGLLNADEKKLYEEIELPLASVLFDMEQTGVCVDEDMLDELSARYRQELKELTAEIYRNAQLALTSSSDILPQVEDEKVRSELTFQHEEYERFSAKAAMLARDKNIELKEPNLMKKAMMWG